MIEAVIVEAPEQLVDALGELGEGRLALVSGVADDTHYAATSLAAKVQGPRAIRRLLARLHAAETLADARSLQASLGEGESVITRTANAWVRAGCGLRVRGQPEQGALLREKDIQQLRSDIEHHQHRERDLEATLSHLRDGLLAAEQQREDVQTPVVSSTSRGVGSGRPIAKPAGTAGKRAQPHCPD